ncbi:MAG TPA: zf-HC2 domain-containing protein, partial [Wenzhouxiangella sp.]|nr:zf-HC2 domain-containing protein [Wenzhouxiangella sp.]
MNPTVEITQELLSAWLDGALDGKQASQVETQLAQSPELQRQLGLMMVNERRLRSEIHRMVAEQPLPASLSALLEEPVVNDRQTLSQRIRD